MQSPRLLQMISGTIITAAAVPARGQAQATEQDAEGWLFAGELQAATAVNASHANEYGVGGGAFVGMYHSLMSPEFQLGAALAAGALINGDREVGDGGASDEFGIGMLNAVVRVQPFAKADGSLARGLWLEVGGGAGLMDEDVAPTFSSGVGCNLGVYGVSLGPAVRYLQGINDASRFDGDDPRLLTLGLQVAVDELPVPTRSET